MDENNKLLKQILENQKKVDKNLKLFDKRLVNIEKNQVSSDKNQASFDNKLDLQTSSIAALGQSIAANRDDVKELTKRIDVLGLAIAEVEDDAPTREEFDEHETRISKIESKISIA